MANSWELICHHTYAGIPGVIADISPSQSSPGIAVGLSDTDFLSNGATPKSGAVNLFKPGASIYVEPGRSWQPLSAMHGEVLLRLQPAASGSAPVEFIIDGDTFNFYIRNGALVAWFSGYPAGFSEVSTALDPVGTPYTVPAGVWTTLGFLHDGLATMELYADGRVIARRTEALWPIDSPGGNGIHIGNDRTANSVLQGQIDDVQIWRLNPHRVGRNFVGRPMDDRAEACWHAFFAAMAAAFARHPECAKEIAQALTAAVNDLIQRALLHDPLTAKRMRAAADEYRKLWAAGQIDGPAMAKLIHDMTKWLQLVGIDPGSDSAMHALQRSACLKLILRELPPIDCDPAFTAFLKALA